MGSNMLGSLQFGEAHKGYISLNIVSGYKFKKKTRVAHGRETSIFAPTASPKTFFAGFYEQPKIFISLSVIYFHIK